MAKKFVLGVYYDDDGDGDVSVGVGDGAIMFFEQQHQQPQEKINSTSMPFGIIIIIQPGSFLFLFKILN